MSENMHQVAPYPHELEKLVSNLRYRQHMGWSVWLDNDCIRDQANRHAGEARGLTLIVQRCGPNTYNHDEGMIVNHYFPVPAATYNMQSWMRWLFDRLGDVDTHERMEDFAFEPETIAPVGAEGRDGLHRPYVPCHGPGWDPYLVTVERTEIDRRTSFRGELNDH